MTIQTLIKKADHPVFLIGSGPSLDNNIKQLSELHKMGILIVLAPAYQRLLAERIMPHFVIATDGGIANRIHLPHKSHKAKNSKRNPVWITTLSVTPHLFHVWKGDYLLINQQLPLEEYLLGDRMSSSCGGQDVREQGEDSPLIPMQGTVASAAFMVAQTITSGPIFLIGLDFAFTRGMYHFKGNALEDFILFSTERFKTYDTQIHGLISRFQRTLVPGLAGGMIATNTAMQSYLHWFEQAIATSKQLVYSVNHEGAIIQGAIPTTFQEIKARIPCLKKEFDPITILKPLSQIALTNIRSKLLTLLTEYQNWETQINEFEETDNYLEKTMLRLSQPLQKIVSFHQSRHFHQMRKHGITSSEEKKEILYNVRRSVNLIKMALKL